MIKSITLLYFLFLSVSSLAQSNTTAKEEWKQLYRKYTQSDISLTMQYKSIEVENAIPITIDSGTVEFYKKGNLTIYEDSNQKIITTTDYLLYVSTQDSLIVVNTRESNKEENQIQKQLKVLDSLIDISSLQKDQDIKTSVFTLLGTNNSIEIHVTNTTKEITKIRYFNTSNTTTNSYTEVIYKKTLFSPVFESNFFSIENYIKMKRKKWTLTKKYNNYTLIAE